VSAVQLAAVTEADEDFLSDLFWDSRAEEFGMLPMEARCQLVAMQLRAQGEHYRRTYPRSVDHVILLAARPVGRCWIDRRPEGIHLVDLAVHSVWRRQGIAAEVLQLLQAEADEVTLSVWAQNAGARALYERAGFEVAGELDGRLVLRWRATAAAGV
jgi:ribosomal protein S18 acetylase RimI-like enzyme